MAMRIRRRLAALAVVSFIVIGFLSLWLWHFGLSDIPMRLSMAKGGPRPKVALRQGTIVGIEAKTGAPQILEEVSKPIRQSLCHMIWIVENLSLQKYLMLIPYSFWAYLLVNRLVVKIDLNHLFR